jgi:glutamine synthetase
VFPTLSADGQANVLKEAMELTPAEKLLWSTDGHLFAETYWLANKQFREILEEVLISKFEHGQLTASQATAFVKDIMFNNSNVLYELGLSLPPDRSEVNHVSARGIETVAERALSALPKDCRYVFAQWVTYMGEIRTRILPLKHFRNTKRFGISRGNTGTLQNDTITSVVNTTGQVYVEPQLYTLRPAGITSNGQNQYYTAMCTWTDENGGAIDASPMSSLDQSLVRLATDYGLNVNIGFELELVFLKRHSNTTSLSYSPLTTTHSWSTFNSQDVNVAFPLLAEIERNLARCGIEIQQMHSESGPGQYEFILVPLPAVEAIHTLYQARQIIQQVAENSSENRHVRATFHACPIPGTGNASHAHISLNDVHKGTEKAKSEEEMDGLEMHFWAGVVEHLRAICGFSMPEKESYERVVEDHWTGGVYVAWGTQNRETPLRRIGGGSHRWEFRALDGFANMYLAMGAIVAAGLEGVKDSRKMAMKDCDVNPARVGEEERRKYGIEMRLPGTIEEALKVLEGDELFKSVFGRLASDYLIMKKAEQEMLDKMNGEDRLAFLVERY